MSAELAEQVAVLTARLQQVEDVLALQQLVARYGPAVDSGSSQVAAQLWTQDGVYSAPPFGDWVGHDAIAGLFDSDGHRELLTGGVGHVLSPPRLAVDGDRARGWNYAMNVRWDAAAGSFTVARLSANTWTFRRHAGRWRVVERVNRPLDGDEQARASLGPGAEEHA